MDVSVETIGSLGRRLTVAVPADQVEEKFKSRLQSLSRQVKFPGFRPGKVPLKMVEAQYGERIINEVAGELIQNSLFEAIGSKGLRPAGDPKVSRKPFARGEQLEYTVEFEILPEVKRLDLKGVRIERPVVSVGDEDVERTLETIRKQRTRWTTTERAAKLGDRVIIDFVGRIGDKEFDGGKAEAFPLILGNGTLLHDMEQGLVGAAPSEQRTIAVAFPSDYGHAPLAGQNAEFDVTVKEISEPILPELDESFARELGIQDGSVEKLRTDVKANLEREASNRARAIVRARALKSLLELNTIEVPRSLITAEMERLKSRDVSARMKPADDKAYETRAHSRVALGLILGEFIRRHELVPDPATVKSRLEEMAAEYESPQEFIRWHYEKPERLNEIEGLVLEEKVVEDLLTTAELVDQPVGFQDLLKLETSAQ